MQKRSLELEDFGIVHEPHASEASEVSAYKERLAQLKAAHASAIEEAKQAAYNEGYAKAIEAGETECEKKIEDRIEAERKRFLEANHIIGGVQDALERTMRQTRDSIKEIVIDSLADILYFLYLEEANAEKISGMIEAILEEFGPALDVTVSLHPSQAETVQALLQDVKIVKDDGIEPGDFKIDFSDFVVEHLLREKIEVIKNEIKKEIEKSAEV